MTRRLLPAVLMLLAGLAGLPAPARAADAGKNPLDSLDWLVGGVWAAEMTGGDGTPLAIQTTFEWAGHKRALKYGVTFTAKGKTVTQYEGTYYWHPGKKSLAMLQVDRDGNVVEATATLDGKTMKQVNTATAAGGTTREQRVEMVRDGDDAYTFRALVPKGGEWAEVVAFKYKRVKPAK